MFCSGIRVEHCLCPIHRAIDCLTRSGKDWTQLLQSYHILSLGVFNEDWIQRLPGQDHRRPLCVCSVLDFDFNIKSLNVLPWVRNRLDRQQQWSLRQKGPDGLQCRFTELSAMGKYDWKGKHERLHIFLKKDSVKQKKLTIIASYRFPKRIFLDKDFTFKICNAISRFNSKSRCNSSSLLALIFQNKDE